jgi:hypothetical protein
MCMIYLHYLGCVSVVFAGLGGYMKVEARIECLQTLLNGAAGPERVIVWPGDVQYCRESQEDQIRR